MAKRKKTSKKTKDIEKDLNIEELSNNQEENNNLSDVENDEQQQQYFFNNNEDSEKENKLKEDINKEFDEPVNVENNNKSQLGAEIKKPIKEKKEISELTTNELRLFKRTGHLPFK